VTRWPPPEDEDMEMRGIYPTLTFSDLPPTVEVKPREAPGVDNAPVADPQFGPDSNSTTTTAPTPIFASAAKQDEAKTDDIDDVPMPGSLFSSNPDLISPSLATNTLAPPKSPQPFIFGSPHNKVTDEQFSATAASVIEEMNQRLKEEGVEGIDLGIINKLHPHANVKQREIKPLPGSARKSAAAGSLEIRNKFDKMHAAEFSKMEGIDSVVKRRERMLATAASNSNSNASSRSGTPQEEDKAVVGKKRKSSAIEIKPRRSSVAPRKVSATGARVASGSVGAGPVKLRVKPKAAPALPGALDFGYESDDAEDEADAQAAERGGKRVRMDPEAPQLTPEEEKEQQARLEEKRAELEKEKEAIKKKLEANRARRRSSAIHGGAALGGRKSGVDRVSGVHGRTSMGRPRQSLGGFFPSVFPSFMFI